MFKYTTYHKINIPRATRGALCPGMFCALGRLKIVLLVEVSNRPSRGPTIIVPTRPTPPLQDVCYQLKSLLKWIAGSYATNHDELYCTSNHVNNSSSCIVHEAIGS